MTVSERTRSERARRELETLSPREREVLERAARGLTNAEVAADLQVTTHAVKYHLAAIYRKLGVSNRTQATARYLEQRFLAHRGSTIPIGR